MGVALDSTLFIDLARRRASAIAKIEELDSRPVIKVIPTPVAYELLAGIIQSGSKMQAAPFRGWVTRFHLADLDLAAAERAAGLRVESARMARPKGAVDILAAGIALAGGHSLVTRDRDFEVISEAAGLTIEPY